MFWWILDKCRHAYLHRYELVQVGTNIRHRGGGGTTGSRQGNIIHIHTGNYRAQRGRGGDTGSRQGNINYIGHRGGGGIQEVGGAI